MYSCLQIPSRENWLQYVLRVYATAINFPYIRTLIILTAAFPTAPWNTEYMTKNEREILF